MEGAEVDAEGEAEADYGGAADGPLGQVTAVEDQYLRHLYPPHQDCPSINRSHLGLVWTRGRPWWVSWVVSVVR
jgi:hypothetical protein